LKAKEVMTGEPRTCSRGTNLPAAAALMLDPDDDVQAVLETMKQHCVWRLPVEGFGGTVMASCR
jgi:hypothetical protein